MPSTYHMNADDELYRAILEYEQQPMKEVSNPDYDPSGQSGYGSWRTHIRVPDGPVVTLEKIVGPYTDVRHIKSYVTRNRRNNNLRIKRVEKVASWEEVEL